ncbi:MULTISPECIES: recombination directionality factor [Frankia]|uniref:Uncharacterized protein n=1 Tax=Frankia alni (strain DSM 45986 / CECT 9034 / ACN14a) TaxID=326424 RepID=Q0RM24_FRAAA|nr:MULTISPECIES: hypothetical protein [Frankia]CAJ61428.1 hypothetical protein; putative DNA-binding domain [Frankia alni ACN14a]
MTRDITETFRLQQAYRRAGAIHVGEAIPEDGHARAVPLETLRFSTQSRQIAQTVAATLGLRPGASLERWTPLGARSPRWRVDTAARWVPVVLPPGEAITQIWQLWRRGHPVRSCDGVTQSSGSTCACPDDEAVRQVGAHQPRPTACALYSRVTVLVEGLPGSWMLTCTGRYGARHLATVAWRIRHTAVQGGHTPAVLAVELTTVELGQEEAAVIAVPRLELAEDRPLPPGVEAAARQRRAVVAGSAEATGRRWASAQECAEAICAARGWGQARLAVDHARRAGWMNSLVTPAGGGPPVSLQELAADRLRTFAPARR